MNITDKTTALELFSSHSAQQMIDLVTPIQDPNSIIEFCSIVNARSGLCSENCSYCSQSIRFKTGVQEYGVPKYDEILKCAMQSQKDGVKHFSLVTSGRGINQEDLEQLLKIIRILKEETSLHLCCSNGIINKETAITLKNAGIERYHHNLETGPKYFPSICTTHTYEERIETILNVQSAGLEICSGGIFGLGETIEDRIDMALDLKKLNVNSIPINILNPIAGTPMEGKSRIGTEELLKSIALYRLIMPTTRIRLAGGRTLLTREEQLLCLKAGINALMTGNYLTTAGYNFENDEAMLKTLNK